MGRSASARSFRPDRFQRRRPMPFVASGAASSFPLVLRSRGRIRLFWSLITLGVFVAVYQLLWTYYEVVLRRDVP